MCFISTWIPVDCKGYSCVYGLDKDAKVVWLCSLLSIDIPKKTLTRHKLSFQSKANLIHRNDIYMCVYQSREEENFTNY